MKRNWHFFRSMWLSRLVQRLYSITHAGLNFRFFVFLDFQDQNGNAFVIVYFVVYY